MYYILGYGETVLTAEEMAARNALERLFRTDISSRPLALGDAGKTVDYSSWASIPNVSVDNWTTKACEERLNQRMQERLSVSETKYPRLSAAL